MFTLKDIVFPARKVPVGPIYITRHVTRYIAKHKLKRLMLKRINFFFPSNTNLIKSFQKQKDNSALQIEIFM